MGKLSKLSKLAKLANDPKVRRLVKEGTEKALPIIQKELEKRKNKSK